MKTEVEHAFKIPQEFLLAQYTSPQFYQARAEQDKVEGFSLSNFKEQGAQVTFDIDRVIVVKTDKLPKIFKKVIERLAGDSTVISTKVEWEKENARGYNLIRAKGVPIVVEVNFEVKRKSDSECVNKVRVAIKVNIPLIGKQLEKFMLPKIEKGVKKDLEKSEAYLLSL